MTPHEEVEHIIDDCVLAVGQGVGRSCTIDHGVVAWLRSRYRDRFLHAMVHNGNSWTRDRHRVTAVSRYLGQRARHYAGEGGRIDVTCITRASEDVERGCQMNAEREAGIPRT